MEVGRVHDLLAVGHEGILAREQCGMGLGMSSETVQV